MMRLHSTVLLVTLALACTPAGGDDEAGTSELGSTTSADATSTAGESSSAESSTGESSSSDSSSSADSTGDSSTSSDSTGSDTTSSDSTGTDSTSESGTDTGGVTCELDDAWEPNAAAEQASEVPWTAADAWSAYRTLDDAYLCAGDDDWYRFDTDSLGYTSHYFYVRALIKEAGLCGAPCGDPVIPAGPQHAMTIDIHRADTLELIGTSSSDTGVLWFNGPGGDAFAHDVLLHVYSTTPEAEYPYRLSVSIRNYDGEDECEC